MQVITRFIQDSRGNIVAGATASIFDAGTTDLVTGLLKVDGTPVSNPLTSTDQGLVEFQAPTGDYDLLVSKGALSYRTRVQVLDIEAAQEAAAAAAGSVLEIEAIAETATDAATRAEAAAESASERVIYKADLSGMKSIDVSGFSGGEGAVITTTGRAGGFNWDASDLSSSVSSDPYEGVYVAPFGGDGSGGAWVRSDTSRLTIGMFGGATSIGTENSGRINALLVTEADSISMEGLGDVLVDGVLTPQGRSVIRVAGTEFINESPDTDRVFEFIEFYGEIHGLGVDGGAKGGSVQKETTFARSGNFDLYHPYFKNSQYHAFTMVTSGSDTLTCRIHSPTFADNYGAPNNSDIYCAESGGACRLEISNPSFSRDVLVQNAEVGSSQTQAIYWQSGDLVVTGEMSIKNMPIGIDNRAGTAVISSIKSEACGDIVRQTRTGTTKIESIIGRNEVGKVNTGTSISHDGGYLWIGRLDIEAQIPAVGSGSLLRAIGFGDSFTEPMRLEIGSMRAVGYPLSGIYVESGVNSSRLSPVKIGTLEVDGSGVGGQVAIQGRNDVEFDVSQMRYSGYNKLYNSDTKDLLSISRLRGDSRNSMGGVAVFDGGPSGFTITLGTPEAEGESYSVVAKSSDAATSFLARLSTSGGLRTIVVTYPSNTAAGTGNIELAWQYSSWQ